MDHSRARVKGSRRYDATRRQERAAFARAAVLDAALVRFIEDGYRSTTVVSIAADAGVSGATIYKTYGGKPGIVRALCEQALAGTRAQSAEVRSDALKATQPDARQVIEGWGRLVAEIAPRVSPILLLLREAADGDPAAAEVLDELEANRLSRMAKNARDLCDAGHLRVGLSAAQARDLLWLYSSPEFYDLLVRRRGWSVQRYSRYVTEAMTAALL